MLKRSVIIICGFLLYSCVKDKPNSQPQPQVQLSKAKKVFIVNEGNFTSGNASVSLYDPETGSVIEDFFKTQNSTALGDVAQSMLSFNSGLYIVVNNSKKIVACDEDLKIKSVISGFTSPRYMLPVSNSKAYVSEFYADHISVLNLNSNSITSTIPCPGWTEKMVLIYNKAFVTNIKKNYVYVINTITDTKTDSIEAGINAGNIVIDKHDNIWVLSSGNSGTSEPGRLSQIDPVTLEIKKTFPFQQNESPGNLCINKTKDTLYFLKDGIYRMATQDITLPNTAFIEKGNRNYYALGVDNNSYRIYAADALDYIQKSNIYVFDATGNQKTFFKAGIISGSFYFE